MTYLEALEFFGSINKMSSALGITRQACQCWRKMGHISLEKQRIIEELSLGILVADTAIERARRVKKKVITGDNDGRGDNN